MARSIFGGTAADYVVKSVTIADVQLRNPDSTLSAVQDVPVLQLVASAVVWLYDAASGGNRVTDLQAMDSSAIDQVTTDAGGMIPQFRGPDEIRSLWADASGGAGPRVRLVAADVGDTLTAVKSDSGTALTQAADAITRVTTLETVGGPAAYL